MVLRRRVREQFEVPERRVSTRVRDIRDNRLCWGGAASRVVTGRLSAMMSCHCADGIRVSATGESRGVARPVRVLLADADAYLLGVYRRCLEQEGFAVTTASSGLACIAALRAAVPDVLVMDPCLLWGSGDGVLALMNEDSDVPRVPVIILTDALDRGVLYRLAPYRVDDFQVKPLSARQLAVCIRGVVRHRSRGGTA